MEFWIWKKERVRVFNQLSRRLESVHQSAGALGSAEMNNLVADSMNERDFSSFGRKESRKHCRRSRIRQYHGDGPVDIG